MYFENVNEQFGNILRKFRESRKMSQIDFAFLCDISLAHYGRLERGENSISLNNCKKIADALGISVADLFADLP